MLLRPQCRAFVVVESELDAMACAAAAEAEGLDVGAISVGTNVGKPDLTAHAILSRALCILVALDFDPPKENGKRPGAQGFEFWARTYRTARRWPVPAGKDPGEAVAAGVDLVVWIRAGLPPVFNLPQSQPVAPAPVAAQPLGQALGPVAREGEITMQSAAFRRFGSYTIANRTFTYRSLTEFRDHLKFVKEQADLEDGTPPYRARVYLRNGGRGRRSWSPLPAPTFPPV